MAELHEIPEDHGSVYETLAQFLYSLDLNISVTALSAEEQGQLINMFEKHMQSNPMSKDGLITDIMDSYILTYVPPVLLLFGIVGNVLSLCILLNKVMKRQTTNIFLAVLAVIDCIVLLVGLLTGWIGNIADFDIQREASWLCKTMTVLTYSSSHFSAWLIVSVTVMRYIAVSMPHQAPRVCSYKNTKRLIISLAVIVFLLNLHFIWTVKLNKYDYGDSVISKCEAEDGFDDFILNIWPWIDASVFVFVPFSLIVMFNTSIIVTTLKATIWRRRNQGESTKKKHNMSRNNVKLTVTLLTVSFSFLVTSLPMASVMILQNYWRRQVDDSSSTVELLSQRRLLRTIAEMLMYLNHSMNFVLYCAVGQKFRNQISKTFCRKKGNDVLKTADHSSHLYCLNHAGKHTHCDSENRETGSTWL